MGSKSQQDDDNKEQGFNDKELEDIMNEIESLEGDSGPGTNVPDSQQPAASSTQVDNVVSIGSSGTEATSPVAAGSTALEFNVEGEMSLALKIRLQGEIVHISLDGNKGMCLRLGSGVEFKIPLKSGAGSCKAG